MNSISVLIADDHPLFRTGMRALLATAPDMEVVGQATTGEEAVVQADELRPDVVLMDLQMPEGSGIEATRGIMQDNPNAQVLIVTMFEDDDTVFAALRAGARGYVLKDTDEEEMLRAIRAIAAGEAIFSPAIATRVLTFFAAPRPGIPKELFPSLTEREREVLHLIAQGASNREIAGELSLSAKTVSNYTSSIYAKLQVADRAQAIVRAREAGMD